MYDDLSKILAKVDALESGNKPEPISKIQELMIDDLTDYIVCPARYYINTNSELKSNKRTVRERSRRAFNTLIFQNIGKSRIQSSQIEKITEEVFSGLSYKTIDMDRKDFISSAIHLSNMLADNEYIINGPLIPITFVHKNTVINSDVSFTIKEILNNFIYPVVIDLSKTRYEP